MEYRNLTLRVEDGIARLRLTRPDRGNAIDARTLAELTDACEAVESNESVVVVLVMAGGDVFCTGWDTETLALDADPFAPLAALPMPVVAALQGAVRDAG